MTSSFPPPLIGVARVRRKVIQWRRWRRAALGSLGGRWGGAGPWQKKGLRFKWQMMTAAVFVCEVGVSTKPEWLNSRPYVVGMGEKFASSWCPVTFYALGFRFHEDAHDTEGVPLLKCRCMCQISPQMPLKLSRVALLEQASSSFYLLVAGKFLVCPVKNHAHASRPVLACLEAGWGGCDGLVPVLCWLVETHVVDFVVTVIARYKRLTPPFFVFGPACFD